MSEPLLPQALDAERALIGCMIYNAEAAGVGVAMLGDNVEAFMLPEHRVAYNAVKALHRPGKPIDVVTYRDELKRQLRKEDVDHDVNKAVEDYLTSVPSVDNARMYGQIVLECWYRRRMIVASSQIKGHGYDRAEDVRDSMAGWSSEFDKMLAEYKAATDVRNGHDVMDLAAEDMRQADSDRWRFGYCDIDSALPDGLRPGRVCIVGGRPGAGKTTLLANLAYRLNAQGVVVGFYSLEMGDTEIGRKLANIACDDCQIDLGSAVHNRVTLDSVRPAVVNLFVEQASATADSLLSSMRIAVRTRKMRCACIDYVQLIKHSGKWQNRNAELEDVSRSLMRFAREHGVLILLASQLSRAGRDRRDDRPVLTDLRDSGALEQDAHYVIGVYKPNADDNIQGNIDRVDVIGLKARTGGTGWTASLIVDWRIGTMRSMDEGVPVEPRETAYADMEVSPF